MFIVSSFLVGGGGGGGGGGGDLHTHVSWDLHGSVMCSTRRKFESVHLEESLSASRFGCCLPLSAHLVCVGGPVSRVCFPASNSDTLYDSLIARAWACTVFACIGNP